MAAKEKEVRATKFESERRVSQVIEWQLSGKTSFEIVQLGVKNWGLGERGVRKYITKANVAVLESMRQTEREEYLARKLHQLEGAVAMGFSQKQPCAVVAAVAAQCKLVGVGAQAAS